MNQNPNQIENPQVFFAAERTLLAWQRSSISFIALVVSIPWTVPMFSKPFIVQSYVIVSIAAAVYAQFFVGDLNILVIELIDAALLFMWMILFVRQIAAIRLDQPTLPAS